LLPFVERNLLSDFKRRQLLAIGRTKVWRRPDLLASPGGCPLLNFAVDADDGNPALRTKVRKALKDWEDLLAKIVEDSQSAGEINPEIDPLSVANLVISMLEGATVVARINKRSAALADAQRHLSLYLETAVRLRTAK
jgi:TetR/AcrR family transcriptional regulator, transcriptional repressor for nem operon